MAIFGCASDEQLQDELNERPGKCFYSGLPYCCDLCPELDDLQEDEKCPNGVCKSDLQKYYVKSRDEVRDVV